MQSIPLQPWPENLLFFLLVQNTATGVQCAEWECKECMVFPSRNVTRCCFKEVLNTERKTIFSEGRC